MGRVGSSRDTARRLSEAAARAPMDATACMAVCLCLSRRARVSAGGGGSCGAQ